MFFSIVTVSFNPGDKLLKTVKCVLNQTCSDFEIIIKDGGSTDGSLELLPQDKRITVISEKDKGIYDGMNMALDYVRGEYVLFLNCGDFLYEPTTLERVKDFITKDGSKKGFYYGDNYFRTRDVVIRFDGKLSDYRLLTRTICHQCIYFSSDVFSHLKYQADKYKVAADLDLYTRIYKKLKFDAVYMPFVVNNYEGDGMSETIQNRKTILNERKQIMQENMSRKEYLKANAQRIISLQAFKEMMGTVEWFRSAYEKMAVLFYSHKNR